MVLWALMSSHSGHKRETRLFSKHLTAWNWEMKIKRRSCQLIWRTVTALLTVVYEQNSVYLPRDRSRQTFSRKHSDLVIRFIFRTLEANRHAVMLSRLFLNTAWMRTLFSRRVLADVDGDDALRMLCILSPRTPDVLLARKLMNRRRNEGLYVLVWSCHNVVARN